MAQPAKIEPDDNTKTSSGNIGADVKHLDNRLTGDIRDLMSDIKEVRTDVKHLSDKMDKKVTSLFQLIMVGFGCLGFLSIFILYK